MLQQMQPGGSLFKYYFTQALHIQTPKGFCDTYKNNVRFDGDVGWLLSALAGGEALAGQPELAIPTAKVGVTLVASSKVTDLLGWAYCGH